MPRQANQTDQTSRERPARQIRKLETEAEFRAFVRISLNAYPDPNAQFETMLQRFQATQANDTCSHFWGVFEDGRMVGGMRLLDFSLNNLACSFPPVASEPSPWTWPSGNGAWPGLS